LYVPTNSSRAEASSETLRSTKLTPFCERYSFAAWQGPQPLAVKILTYSSAIYVTSFHGFPLRIFILVAYRLRLVVSPSSRRSTAALFALGIKCP
jgi:hypothetical protein